MKCNAMQALHAKQSLTSNASAAFIPSVSKLTEQLSFRVAPTLYELVERIAESERRKPNEVARALLERGVAAYRRDGQIFEPEEAQGLQMVAQPARTEGTKKGGRSKAS